MAEAHLKTAGVPKSTRHQENVPVIAIRPADTVANEFKALKFRRQYRYILLKIENDQIQVDQCGPRTDTLEEFMHALPEAECRYAIYEHELKTHDGRINSKLYFVTWIPQSSAPGYKMAYAHAKNSIRSACDGTYDINVATKAEVMEAFGVGDRQASESGSDFED